MKYLMFIKHDEGYRNQAIPPGLNEAMGKFVDESFKNGTLVDTAGLKPTKDGLRVRLAKGKVVTTDGPFTGTKEIIGGYAIVSQVARARARDRRTVHGPASSPLAGVRGRVRDPAGRGHGVTKG
jgi:hypothetical protein